MSVQPIHPVPHLTTALTGPLLQLESLMLEYQNQIETWFRKKWLQHPPPFYTSVDLRNAGFKLAPVDTNLFPAGFNNLNPAFLPLCIQAVQAAIERICPDAAKILLVPENHDRNQFYLESLATLQDIIAKAGFSVRIGSVNPELEKNREFNLASGRKIVIEPLIREGNKVGVKDFWPCTLVLNNDLSSGVPSILEGVDQTITPPTNLGWTSRSKTNHFKHYQQVAQEFAQMIDIDPWLIDPLFRNCGEIDFKKHEGETCVAKNVEALLNDISNKYQEYNIDSKPFVIVKADSGTYGMAIMTVHDPEQVIALNRKQRNKMASGKEGLDVSRVILQEGVYTFETWGGTESVAEPVVYLIDHYVVGGFYRVHTSKRADENLNAPGMQFHPLAFVEPCNSPNINMSPDAEPNRFYAYGVIARLAQLAAIREMQESTPKQKAPATA